MYNFRKISKALIATSVFFLGAYLIGSFIHANFDINKWTDLGRILVGTIGGLVSLIIGGVTLANG